MNRDLLIRWAMNVAAEYNVRPIRVLRLWNNMFNMVHDVDKARNLTEVAYMSF